MKKKTYYWKDACRIYWRIEFTFNHLHRDYFFSIKRSLDSHDDPNAGEVFHGFQRGDVPDPKAAVIEMGIYYASIIEDMSDQIASLYEPLVA